METEGPAYRPDNTVWCTWPRSSADRRASRGPRLYGSFSRRLRVGEAQGQLLPEYGEIRSANEVVDSGLENGRDTLSSLATASVKSRLGLPTLCGVANISHTLRDHSQRTASNNNRDKAQQIHTKNKEPKKWIYEEERIMAGALSSEEQKLVNALAPIWT